MAHYAVDRTLSASEAYVTPSTSTLTDYDILIVLTTTKSTTILPQFSTDSGTTWSDHADGIYSVDTTTDSREITGTGIMRLAITNADASNTNTIDLDVTATSTTETGAVSTIEVYRAAGITSAVIPEATCVQAILRATSEVRQMTGVPVGTEELTETYWGNNKKSLFLHHTPIYSLDTLEIDDTSITVTYVDVVKETGQIILKTDAETTRFTLPTSENPEQYSRNCEVTYTWGYYPTPYWLQRLVECTAAIMILTTFTGGTYDDWTSWTIGDLSVGVGEPYMNLRQTVIYLKQEINDIILKNVKKRPAVF